MPILFSDFDLAGLVSDVGEDVQVSDAGVIQGVFRSDYEALELGQLSAEGLREHVIVTAADVARLGMRKDTVLVIRGTTYKIRRIETMRPGLDRVILALP